MPRSRLLLIGCVVVGLVAVALLVYARTLTERFGAGLDSRPPELRWAVGFSAEFEFEDSADPSKNCTGRMYVNVLHEPRGMRRDTDCGGRKRTYLWRQDGFEAVLDPDSKVYWKAHPEKHLTVLDKGPQRRHIGRETVNGRLVDHYETSSKGEDSRAVVSHVWEDLRLHSPIRVVTGSTRYELTNVQEGGQSEELFTVPEGFREIAGPKE